jgi:hypothetical protein
VIVLFPDKFIDDSSWTQSERHLGEEAHYAPILSMATVKGSAAYKKKDGTLTVSKDQKTIQWTPIAPRGAPPGITITISEITSMSRDVLW